jgi:poly-gamma-glutamate capsule biosynthesis protein CapA/YwtB (metallophosphatase superfamily)
MRRLPLKPKSSRRAAKAQKENEIVVATLSWGAEFGHRLYRFEV